MASTVKEISVGKGLTAYSAYRKAGGTWSYEEWSEKMSKSGVYAESAEEAMTAARESATRAETAADKAEHTADDFEVRYEQAIIGIVDKGTEQTQRLETEGDRIIQRISDTEDGAVGAVTDAKESALTAVSNAQTGAVETVDTAKTNAVSAVGAAQTTGVQAVNSAKDIAVEAVQTEGETQVQAVADKGTEQVQAVADKGAEQITAIETKGAAPAIIETASGAIASFDDGAEDRPIKSLVAHIEPVQEGSGDPSPDNVRPITGWTGVKVARTGKNLINVADFTLARNGSRTIGMQLNIPCPGSFTLSLRVEKNTTKKSVTFSLRNRNSTDYITLAIISVPAGQTGLFQTTFTLTTVPIGYLYSFISAQDNEDATITITDVQLEVGSTVTDYEPYQGQTYEVTFPTEAGTVYGGTLDVVTGNLVVDRAMSDLGSLAWTIDTTARFKTGQLAPIVKRASANTEILAGLICEMYKPSASDNTSPSSVYDDIIGVSTFGNLLVKDTSYATVDDFVSAVTGIKVVYPLANPQEITLTPTEIRTLLGINNVWADTGSADVTYQADTKMYIDKKITELQALILENIGG